MHLIDPQTERVVPPLESDTAAPEHAHRLAV
jgi:hypothetical protein